MTAADNTGFETLQAIEKAGKFNRWMFDAVAPYCSGNILEIGSGIGNISQFLQACGSTFTLSDIDDYYLVILHQKFDGSASLKEILSVDLQDVNFTTTYARLKEQYDTVIMLNVLEHLEDEKLAAENCFHMLKPGGSLIVLVPAYKWLYSRMDKELGHKRRYTAATIQALLTRYRFQIVNTFYFNAIGIGAWLYGKVGRLKKIPSTEMSVFDHLTGVGKFIDRLLLKRMGLSVISIAKKPLS